tara:strand:- start:1350 stop:1634 length:285 start_codon:yes stop_codon:yes gene_type:complete
VRAFTFKILNKYYCPYCSSHYQFQKIRADGVLVCGQCGDPMIKKKLINVRKLFALVAALAFLSPLVIMVVSVINESINEDESGNSSSIVLISYE